MNRNDKRRELTVTRPRFRVRQGGGKLIIGHDGPKNIVKIIGCGGAGGNFIARMLERGIEGVDLCTIDTDPKRLLLRRSGEMILIDRTKPERADSQILRFVKGCEVIFLIAGLGGSTGTRASKHIASLAKRTGYLVTGIFILPFTGEGRKRARIAGNAIDQLSRTCDTVVAIRNDTLLRRRPMLSLNQAFRLADEMVCNGIVGTLRSLNYCASMSRERSRRE